VLQRHCRWILEGIINCRWILEGIIKRKLIRGEYWIYSPIRTKETYCSCSRFRRVENWEFAFRLSLTHYSALRTCDRDFAIWSLQFKDWRNITTKMWSDNTNHDRRHCPHSLQCMPHKKNSWLASLAFAKKWAGRRFFFKFLLIFNALVLGPKCLYYVHIIKCLY
jgi:hypothetical protein